MVVQTQTKMRCAKIKEPMARPYGTALTDWAQGTAAKATTRKHPDKSNSESILESVRGKISPSRAPKISAGPWIGKIGMRAITERRSSPDVLRNIFPNEMDKSATEHRSRTPWFSTKGAAT